MREIIFKGKTKISGRWIEGNLIVKKFENNLQTLEGEKLSRKKYSIQYKGKKNRYLSLEVCESTIGQYTGHVDKNSIKIFEKDKVYVESEDEMAIIIWDYETARFIIQFNDWCADFDNYYGKEMEVICDTPELLEETENG